MYLFSVMHIFLFSHFAFRILLCAMCCACVRVVWSYVVFACCLIVRCDFLYMFSVFCYIFVLAFSIFYFCFLLFVSVFGFCFFCIQVCACALLDRALWFSLYVFCFLLLFFCPCIKHFVFLFSTICFCFWILLFCIQHLAFLLLCCTWSVRVTFTCVVLACSRVLWVRCVFFFLFYVFLFSTICFLFLHLVFAFSIFVFCIVVFNATLVVCCECAERFCARLRFVYILFFDFIVLICFCFLLCVLCVVRACVLLDRALCLRVVSALWFSLYIFCFHLFFGPCIQHFDCFEKS